MHIEVFMKTNLTKKVKKKRENPLACNQSKYILFSGSRQKIAPNQHKAFGYDNYLRLVSSNYLYSHGY